MIPFLMTMSLMGFMRVQQKAHWEKQEDHQTTLDERRPIINSIMSDRYRREEAKLLHQQKQEAWEHLRTHFPELPPWPEFPMNRPDDPLQR